MKITNQQLRVEDLDLTLDTALYASGDLLADTQDITLVTAVPLGGLRGEIVSVALLDKNDQGGALDLLFLDSAGTLGVENAAANLDATAGARLIAAVPVAAAAYLDLGGVRLANPALPNNAPIPFNLADGILRVAAISRDAKTYTATGLRLRLTWRDTNFVN